MASQSYGLANNSTAIAAFGQDIAVSLSQSGTVTRYLFSGGAQAANTAWKNGLIDQSKINYVVYVSPGFGPGPGSNILQGAQGTYWISNPFSVNDILANQSNVPSVLTVLFDDSITFLNTSCDHNFAYVAGSDQYGDLFSSINGEPCGASSTPEDGGAPDPDSPDPDDAPEDRDL